MKYKKLFVFVLLILFALLLTIRFSSCKLSRVSETESVKTYEVEDAKINIFFSPRGGCTEAVVETLNHAKKNIYVQAYSFTSKPIAEALVNASKRKVHVEIILDKSQRSEQYSSADFVAHAKIPTYIDTVHAIAHNKIMVIDEEKVITGSFNFTKSAEQSNAENLLIIEDTVIAHKYLSNWQVHKKHSSLYEGK